MEKKEEKRKSSRERKKKKKLLIYNQIIPSYTSDKKTELRETGATEVKTLFQVWNWAGAESLPGIYLSFRLYFALFLFLLLFLFSRNGSYFIRQPYGSKNGVMTPFFFLFVFFPFSSCSYLLPCIFNSSDSSEAKIFFKKKVFAKDG